MLRRLVLAGTAGCLALGLCELALRAFQPERFLPYHAHIQKTFYPSEEITPGVSGVSHFSTNAFGTRGPELRGERLRILTVGGSTTACTVLDDSEEWPQLLMRALDESEGDPSYAWVTNSGLDGKNSHHHLMHAIYLLPRLPDLDYAIYYCGLNDVGLWLYHETFDPDALADASHWDSCVGEAFRVSSFTPADWPWYKHTRLWKLASVAKARYLGQPDTPSAEASARRGPLQDAQLQWMEQERRERQERSKEFVHRAKMETLPVALDAYGHVLRLIVARTRDAGVEPVLMAQAIQHQFLDEAEKQRLWMGAMDGGKTYVDEQQMLELVDAFNARMASVAQELEVPFIDLPALLAGERDLFYDGCHFNELGARRVAQVVAPVIQDLVHRGGR